MTAKMLTQHLTNESILINDVNGVNEMSFQQYQIKRGNKHSKQPCKDKDASVSKCKKHGKVCPVSAHAASLCARREVERLFVGSSIFKSSTNADGKSENLLQCATINIEDLDIGSILGKGGFCVVRMATIKKGGQRDRIAAQKEEGGEYVSSSAALKVHPLKTEQTQYALKALSRNVMVKKREFKLGAADLATEAHFLSVLQHPHIIKLHGVSDEGSEKGFASGLPNGFFLLLDILHTTLEERIFTWKRQSLKYKGIVYRNLHDFRKRKRCAMLNERLHHAADLAGTMQYLHSRRIIYRDLKPDNVGYDSQGVLKLFDFGLAMDLRNHERNIEGTYELSGHTGSRRYMSPEVALSKPYDERVDVYSFGIVLHEISSMEKPFEGWSCTTHIELAVQAKVRPYIKHPKGKHSFWPSELVDLIKACWDHDMSERPDFDSITNVLDKICGDIERQDGKVVVTDSNFYPKE